MNETAALSRDNNFDALRLIAAVSVIFSHSFFIAEGNEMHEPLIWLTGRQAILGLAGVFVFFAISGFLVTQSWEHTASPARFLAKRCLRIFPGLFVALVLSSFVLSAIVTTLPLMEYFRRPEPYLYVVHNMELSVETHELPGVMFVDNPVGLEVNGSLWTLRYEFMMYLMVLGLGWLRLLNLWVCLALLALGMACIYFPALDVLGGWGWMLSFFASGMVLYKLRDTRIFDDRVALLALLGLAASIPLRQFILLFPLFGCYLALYLALHPRLPRFKAARYGDLSYGLYIYGWPSEQLVIWLQGGHAPWWRVFLPALALASCLAFLSWHLIEAPALRLKPRSRAPIAAQAAGD
ncbi:MAG TPA: acyltransferase [Stellaceae bacterium]|nr:acyltransferase [Stellaceae bacterium]